MQVEKVVADLVVQHGDYDPVKAHEYYMRTRKLVGRKVKGIKVSNPFTTKTTVRSNNVVDSVNGKPTSAASRKKQQDKQRAEFQKQVALDKALKTRAILKRLKQIEKEERNVKLSVNGVVVLKNGKTTSKESQAKKLAAQKKEFRNLLSAYEIQDGAARSKKTKAILARLKEIEKRDVGKEGSAAIAKARKPNAFDKAVDANQALGRLQGQAKGKKESRFDKAANAYVDAGQKVIRKGMSTKLPGFLNVPGDQPAPKPKKKNSNPWLNVPKDSKAPKKRSSKKKQRRAEGRS